MVRVPSLFAISVAALAVAQGCGSDATGVDACQAVMTARCQRAPACKINLDPPHATSGSDVEACVRFYDIACLHGVASSDPGPTKVRDCVAAIQSNGCGVVGKPETDPACAWLVPTPAASNDASSDAPSEAGDVATGQ